MIEFLKKLTNFITLEHDSDKALKEFLRAEYKKDWQAAYAWYLEEGTLPNFPRREI
jgi:hypothetical protein|tara:strand:- start:337 stop:504 length:168 start_codon:yes stop_codon:yes gene_type:complete